MQATLKARLEQLKAQQKQGETMLANVSNEILMIKGAIAEATAFLNHLNEEEKKAADAKAKEEAKKSKGKKKSAPQDAKVNQEDPSENDGA